MAFRPTCEQQSVIDGEERAVFVSACPGAGKTRIMVERARRLLADLRPGRGVAFLSFTNAAISELESRLRREGLLQSPVYPNFVGTFDSFIWAFCVAPFGVQGNVLRPKLVPDIENRTVEPFRGAQPLPLHCFDKETGAIIPEEANLLRYYPRKKKSHINRAYCTAASNMRQNFIEKAQVDFDGARELAISRIQDDDFARRLGAALAGRFEEVIVDEAQDCNPNDLEIIEWLKAQDIPIRIICDPFQSIYEFRGGVTEHLMKYRDTFDRDGIQTLSGNFRSSDYICKAISVLRPSGENNAVDRALGPNKNVIHPIKILAYPGRSVPAEVGPWFAACVAEVGEDLAQCPILASTHHTAAAAVGHKADSNSQNKLLKLAQSVSRFYKPASFGDMKNALKDLHKIVLELEGLLQGRSYDQYLSDNDINDIEWRPRILDLMRKLRFDPTRDGNARGWHEHVKQVLSNKVTVSEGVTIGRRLSWKDEVEGSLTGGNVSSPTYRSIHSAKGLEFPAVCVVLSPRKAKGVLDYLEVGQAEDYAEDARKLYVGASRAERLLAFALPIRQAKRLRGMLTASSVAVVLAEI